MTKLSVFWEYYKVNIFIFLILNLLNFIVIDFSQAIALSLMMAILTEVIAYFSFNFYRLNQLVFFQNFGFSRKKLTIYSASCTFLITILIILLYEIIVIRN